MGGPSEQEIERLLGNFRAGRVDIADGIAHTITQKHPGFQFGWKILGVIAKQGGRLSDALAATQRALLLDPSDAEAHNNLCVVLKDLGRLEVIRLHSSSHPKC